ncbi:NAD-binding protein [Actinomycetes bacterium M1A6_2h]
MGTTIEYYRFFELRPRILVRKHRIRRHVTDYTYPEIVFPNLKQGFTLELMRKDARLAGALADHVGQKLRVGSLVAELVDEAVGRLGGTADQTDLMQNWYSPVAD